MLHLSMSGAGELAAAQCVSLLFPWGLENRTSLSAWTFARDVAAGMCCALCDLGLVLAGVVRLFSLGESVGSGALD